MHSELTFNWIGCFGGEEILFSPSSCLLAGQYTGCREVPNVLSVDETLEFGSYLDARGWFGCSWCGLAYSALGGRPASNMAVVSGGHGLVDAFASNPTQLLLDISVQ